MTISDALPFHLETLSELAISEAPEWREGLEYGQPRPGHPEGQVKFHIAAVLANLDRFFASAPSRPALRLIALVHDSFKFQVDPARPKSGENHHGMLARRFAEKHIEDGAVLDVIETHDDAYNAWQKGHRDHHWPAAEDRARRLIERLGDTLPLYLDFYRCDNETDGKSSDPYDWFVEFARNHSIRTA